MRVGSVGTKSRASGSAGFTITELLVVMVIIGILAAIIFPVVTKTKETARTGQCLSNLRQLGSSLTIYVDSYDSRFPAAAPWGNPNYWRQSRYGSQKTIQELLKPFVRNGMNADESHLYRAGSVFVCPSDVGIDSKQWVYGCPPDQPVWRYAGCSYEYYASDQTDSEAYDPKNPCVKIVREWTGLSPEVSNAHGYHRIGAPISKVVSPGRKAVLGDMWYWHMGDKAPEYNGTGTWPGRLAYRNTLFADGHAQRVSGQAHVQARLQPLARWHDFCEVPDD